MAIAGAIALTIANYSAIIFAYPTRAAGAWEDHPLAYWGLYLSYVPIVALTGLYVWWASSAEMSVQTLV